jgi:hypothetical protein
LIRRGRIRTPEVGATRNGKASGAPRPNHTNGPSKHRVGFQSSIIKYKILAKRRELLGILCLENDHGEGNASHQMEGDHPIAKNDIGIGTCRAAIDALLVSVVLRPSRPGMERLKEQRKS